MADKKEKKGLFYFLGCVFKVVFSIIKLIIMVVWKVLRVTGLILPMLYAIAGLILYLLVGFNPFLFRDGPMFVECILYAVGFGLSCLAALIISIKNLVIKPASSFKQGFDATLVKKDKKEEDNVEMPEKGLQDVRIEEPKTSYHEKPKVYFSEMQNRLIHEYRDRFEVFILKGKEEVLEKVEYKIEDQR